MRPWYFFGRFFFVMGACLICLVISTFFKIGPILGSVEIALLFGLNFVLSTYASSTLTTVIPGKSYGFISAIQGSFNMLAILASSGISALKLTAWLNSAVLLGAISFTCVFVTCITFTNKKAIVALDSEEDPKNDGCCYRFVRKWIYGYPDREYLF